MKNTNINTIAKNAIFGHELTDAPKQDVIDAIKALHAKADEWREVGNRCRGAELDMAAFRLEEHYRISVQY